jgi:hypothetical protein
MTTFDMGSQPARPYKLGPDDDGRRIAARLLRQEMLKQPTSDCNRRITHPLGMPSLAVMLFNQRRCGGSRSLRVSGERVRPR